MATTTPRIGLTKPDGTDLVDIAVLNTNFDKIDSNIASTKIQSTKPTTANAGDLWWDSDTGTLYLYYTDANSSQWVAATSDPINIGVVANQTERDAQYPSPQQGMRVYRTDLGATETYYGLYNISTNPGGRSAAGWYQEPAGRVLQVVSTSNNSASSTTSSSWQNTSTTATITPKKANSIIMVSYSVKGFSQTTNEGVGLITVFRGNNTGTNIANPYQDGAMSQSYKNSAFTWVLPAAAHAYDSPNTISAQTYTLCIATAGIGTVAVNGIQTLTLMEISA